MNKAELVAVGKLHTKDKTPLSSFHFDPSGREQYETTMKGAGYVEIPQFKPHLDGYTCASCEYMRKNQKSPTGFWCSKLSFPDRPEGCCDQWQPMPGLVKEGNNAYVESA